MNLPNRITLSRLFLIPLFMVFTTSIPIYIDKFLDFNLFSTYGIYIAAGIFIIAAATDKLDGYYARKYNQVTKLGIFLDPLVDKLLISSALIILVQMHRVSWFVALAIIGREFAVTLFRLSAAQKGLVLPADRTGKLKMVLQVVAVIVTMLDNYPLSLLCTFRFDILLMNLAAIFTLYSGMHYFKVNRHVFSEDVI